jgi:putative peptide zinc metalloprotease protein
MYADPTSLSLPAWLDEPVGLGPEVTQLYGANGQPMLYLPATRGYLRLSRSGAAITALLDGTVTGTDVVANIASRQPAGATTPVDQLVADFLEELRAAHALTVPSDPTPGRNRLRRLVAVRRHVPLLRSVEPIVRLPAGVVRRFPRLVIAALAALGGGAAVAAFLALTERATHSGSVAWWFVPIVVVLEVTLHELGHATVCEALGAPVREAGVALWCSVVPIAYVDCTDAYRLPERHRRVAIALAGPVVDVLAAGVTALVALAASGAVAATAHLVLAVQVVLVLSNLNPLLPTDGYHAVEAGLGTLNFRRRAFAYTAHLLVRRPLPATLRSVRRTRGLAYVTYSLAAALYVAFIFAVVVTALPILLTGGGR